MFKKYLNSRSGFTLIEAIAVIGVLAVTSAVLIVNNRLNELQLSLNNDTAAIVSAVSKAKALTLQGVGADAGICGYGVSFKQGENNSPDTYSINSYTNCADFSGKVALVGRGGENNLSTGLRILNITDLTSDTQFIKDVIFYSSDAKVRLFSFDNRTICEVGCGITSTAGVIVINTESTPTSFITLKIATTGQVTSKPGAYSNVVNFDSSSELILSKDSDGNFIYEGVTEPKVIVGEEGGAGTTFEEVGTNCIPNCFCALNLSSGGTCSDTCGGICYAGGGSEPACLPLPTDCQMPNNTCADIDSCGASCAVCDVSNNNFCNAATKSCAVCSVCPVDVKGDTCGGCFGNCKGCDGSGAGYTCTNVNSVWACRVIEQDLILSSVYPPVGYK